MRLLVMMIRPPVALLLMVFAAIGTAAAGRGNELHPLLTVDLLVIGGWFVHAAALNDLGDEPIDRVNLAHARGRPLVSGHASRARLLALGLAAGVVALLGAWSVNARVGTVVTVGLALNVAYSVEPLRLSRRGLLAVVLLPLGYVALPYLVGVFSVQPGLGPNGFEILVGLYVAFMGRIVLKDFRDEAGDALFGKRTFLVRQGRHRTCAFSAACWIAGTGALVVMAPLPPVLVAVFAAYLACVLYGLYLLARGEDYVADQVVIAAIAQIGRGMCISVLAHLTMASESWPVADQTVVHVLVAIAFAGLYADALGARRTANLAAVRPY